MTSELQRRAIERLIDKANTLGVEVPPAVASILHHDAGTLGGVLYANAHPDEDTAPIELLSCCTGASVRGLAYCTCWEPVYAVEQAPARPPQRPEDLKAQPRMCGDCAFRKGSPEREDEYLAEELMALPSSSEVFWCHTGLRLPVEWRHPSGATIPGDPADYQPLVLAGIPYQADGTPALLCAGWAARAGRAAVVEA